MIAPYSVVGEREQGTLEPVLSTPVHREELLVGKALAAIGPSTAMGYALFALFLVVVQLFADSTSSHHSFATGVLVAPLGAHPSET